MWKFLSLCALLALPSYVLAVPVTGGMPTVELGIGSSLTRFNYKELCTPSDQESATYNSLVGNFKYHPSDMYSSFEVEYESGTTNSTYSGAVLSTGQSIIATDSLKFVDYQAKINLALSENVFLYAGFGHHSWLRVLNNAYSEKYQWDFIPVGMLAWYLKDEIVDLGVDVTLKPMMNATIHGDTSDYRAGGQDSDAPLGNKTGFRVKLPIVWHYGAVSLETSPWFEHIEIGQSNPFVNTTLFTSSPYEGFEPNSETYIYGFEVLASVHF